ncbi:hypothetical protein K503DRAFT_813490 [Rhizopogon vinicolor AM-OR11-026]|uniref:Uncharacterized protein n=1 Tax=Rhizopogon vinicolor AM-OR11-026 TaxID=1314800 RepID=A0A1B7MFK6_9AGAM|nr:hypothetical protein K503DRAFT_813490 [Rhizopogon vinicolor AM-OR11-026]
MTFLYLGYLPPVSLTDAVGILCTIVAVPMKMTPDRGAALYFVLDWINIIVNGMLGVIVILSNEQISGEEYILSGVHMCGYHSQVDSVFLDEMSWILSIAWETLTLCLAIWIAVKHFRELQRPSTRWTAEDCFTISVKTHVVYFASSTLVLLLCPPNSNSMAAGAFLGMIQIVRVVQMFMLGPRLVLGVREYHANLVANSDEGTVMASISFDLLRRGT